MDQTPSEVTSGGACHGRGGVRYWVYLKESGDTFHLPTPRHYDHPKPLNEEELKTLAYAYLKNKTQPSYTIEFMRFGGVLVIALSIGFVFKKFYKEEISES